MQMTIFTADCVGNAANCSYPNKVEVKCPKDMETAVARDHVCATYTNNYRNEQNFLESDVIPMDIDNDHSEDPKDWITEEKMKEMFGSIDFILVPSRHHMVKKTESLQDPSTMCTSRYLPSRMLKLIRSLRHCFRRCIRSLMQTLLMLRGSFSEQRLMRARLYGMKDG